MGAFFVANRAAQTQNAHTLMTINLIFNADTAERRARLVNVIVVAMDVQDRGVGIGGDERQIIGG